MLETPKSRSILPMEQFDGLANQQVHELVRAAWVAGIVDGEGCVSAYYPKAGTTSIMCNVAVANSDPTIIATLDCILTDWRVGHYVYTHNTKHLPSYRIDVRGLKRCQTFLPIIIPFLVSRAEEARILLDLINYRLALHTTKPLGEFEADCLKRIQELKRVRHLRDFVPSSLYCRDEGKVHAG